MNELKFQAYPNNLGEAPLWLSLCDHKDVTVEYKIGNESSKRLADIFRHKAKIVGKENPITIQDTINKYFINGMAQHLSQEHCIKRMFFQHGIESDNYIPKIELEESEKSWAEDFLKEFKNPIPLCIFSGGYKSGHATALVRLLPMDKWNIIINELSQRNYSCLSVTTSKHHINFNKNLIPILDLTPREQAAIFHVCKKIVSIESGQPYLALSAGAEIFRMVPTLGYSNGFLYSNWNYTDDMWKYEKRRMFDFLFKDFDKILKYFPA